MEFEFSESNGICILELSGNLIGENDGMPLNDTFNEKVEDGTKNFLVDLTNLQHINSSGLGVLITLLTRARKRGGEMVLVNPSEYIRNLMMITKLNTIFKVYPSREEAMAEFN